MFSYYSLTGTEKLEYECEQMMDTIEFMMDKYKIDLCSQKIESFLSNEAKSFKEIRPLIQDAKLQNIEILLIQYPSKREERVAKLRAYLDKIKNEQTLLKAMTVILAFLHGYIDHSDDSFSTLYEMQRESKHVFFPTGYSIPESELQKFAKYRDRIDTFLKKVEFLNQLPEIINQYKETSKLFDAYTRKIKRVSRIIENMTFVEEKDIDIYLK